MFIRMKNDVENESKEINFIWSQVVEGSLKPQLRHQCNPMDGGAWWATIHGVARVGHSLATKQQ